MAKSVLNPAEIEEVRETTRNAAGQFVKGQSGNPTGRKLGSKNIITALKQDLEIAVRKNVAAPQIAKILDRMCELAMEGNVSAAKLILDKTLSNAKEADDVQEANSGFTFVVKNITFKAEEEDGESDIIDITPQKEVKDEI